MTLHASTASTNAFRDFDDGNARQALQFPQPPSIPTGVTPDSESTSEYSAKVFSASPCKVFPVGYFLACSVAKRTTWKLS